MASRPSVSVPTTAALPHAHRLPPNSPLVEKTLAKLSRPSLLTLVLEWLKSSNQTTCAPFRLRDDDDEDDLDEAPYPAARTLEELIAIYGELQARKGAKREVLDRILEGDWRHGISLRQLAMADLRYLLDHSTGQRWTALGLKQVTLSDDSEDASDEEFHYTLKQPPSSTLPRFHAPTFLQNLQAELAPFMKAHYYLTRATSMPLTLLRMYIHDSPYNSQRSLLSSKRKTGEGSKIIYVAFPDGSPSIYVSLGTTPGATAAGDSRHLRDIVLDALPKAFSRPQQRYTLKPTSLSTRSLFTLLSLQGPGRGNAAAGGWSIFADGSIEESPLDSVSGEHKASHTKKTPPTDQETPIATHTYEERKRKPPNESDTATTKRRKLLAKQRFGTSAIEGDSKGIERLEIRIEDPYPPPTPDSTSNPNPASEADTPSPTPPPEPITQRRGRGRPSRTSILDATLQANIDDESPANAAQATWTPAIRLTFHGTHVFAGIRHLVESGVVDGEKMPGWMTGEEGVSVGVVRAGRVLGEKGARGL